MPSHYGRGAAADFEPLPGRNRGGQPVMGGKMAQMTRITALNGHGTVGNPDAFPIEIGYARCRIACLFLRTSSWKKRPVQNRQGRLSRWIRNGDRKDAGILVVHAVELNALIRQEGNQSQALPVE